MAVIEAFVVTNRFKLQVRTQIQHNRQMGCRPLTVIAVVIVGLVPAVTTTSARVPATRSATAMATILPRAVTPDDQSKVTLEKRRIPIGGKTPASKYIDEDGFITSPTNPQGRRIIIVDLP